MSKRFLPSRAEFCRRYSAEYAQRPDALKLAGSIHRWKKFDRIFSTGDTEVRYIREIVFGKRRSIRYWQITTDSVALPENSTWFIMTNLPGDIQKSVGNTYGLRTWIEYGFKQVKDELGWADNRLTEYEDIEKWWEIVCSAYLMVSLQTIPLKDADKKVGLKPKELE